MKYKCDIKTDTILKHKAMFNVDGSKIRKCMHHDETYALVTNW